MTPRRLARIAVYGPPFLAGGVVFALALPVVILSGMLVGACAVELDRYAP